VSLAIGQSKAMGLDLQQKRPSKNPNIIYIYADDLGYNELGSYGQKKIRTPNLDLLAKEGIRFTQHYSGSPVCAPARCMLLTGRHPGHSYVRSNYRPVPYPREVETGSMPLPEGTFTIGHMLQQAGYVTGAIGKWGLGMHNNTGDPNKQGFDYFFGYQDQVHAHNFYPTYLRENGLLYPLDNPYIDVHRTSVDTKDENFDYYSGREHSIEKMTEKAQRFIKLYHNKPFFLYLPYTIPHASLQLPEEEVKNYIGLFPDRSYYGDRGYASVENQLSTYAAMITHLDKQVGVIMDLIKSLGLDKNTIIMFSSDNGPQDCCGVDINFFQSTGRLRASKGSIYEGGIRVPFIARWPGKIPSGVVSDFISVQYDMMSTIADIIGILPPANDGISILPSMMGRDNDQEQRSYIYWEYPSGGGQLAIRMGNWKAVKTDVSRKPENLWQLYDLSKDISESNDVAGSHLDLINQFDIILRKEHRPAHIREWNFIDQSLLKE
jgi:arylsulfatase A-like enzyme